MSTKVHRFNAAASNLQLIGFFSPNGFQTIREGVPVKIAFLSDPGKVFDTHVETVLGAMGEGQIGVSGILAKASAVGAAESYPVRLAVPAEIDPGSLRLGMGGTAVAIAPDAGPIGLLAIIIIYVQAFALYL